MQRNGQYCWLLVGLALSLCVAVVAGKREAPASQIFASEETDTYVRLLTDNFVAEVSKDSLTYTLYFRESVGGEVDPASTPWATWTIISIEEYGKKDCDGLFDLLGCVVDALTGLVRLVVLVLEDVVSLVVEDVLGSLITVTQRMEVAEGKPGAVFSNVNIINKETLANYEFAGESKDIPFGSYKFQFDIDSWGGFNDKDTGELQVTAKLEVSSDLTVDFQTRESDDFLETIFFSKGDYVWQLRLNKKFKHDAVFTKYLNRISYTSLTETSYNVMFAFPPFQESLSYDPDFSVLLGPSDGGDGDGTIDGYTDGYGYTDETTDGTSEDGTAEDGTVEDGTAEDGTVEDGIAEDGTAEDGATDGTADDGIEPLPSDGETNGGNRNDSAEEDNSGTNMMWAYIFGPLGVVAVLLVGGVSAMAYFRFRRYRQLKNESAIRAVEF